MYSKLLVIGFVIFEVSSASAQERTKEQIVNAKRRSSEVVVDEVSHAEFAKRYPTAKILNADNAGFKEYEVNRRPFFVRHYAFVGDKILARKMYIIPGQKGDPEKTFRIVEEQLGRPNKTDLDEAAKKDNVQKRYEWWFEEPKVKIIGSIVPDPQYGEIYVEDILNVRNIEDAQRKFEDAQKKKSPK